MKNINIIFEDNYLIAVNKPSGLLVVPTPKKEKHTLVNIVKDILKERGSPRILFPCHRLDRDTSGLNLFAKSREIEHEIFLAFKDRKVDKKYIALISGCPRKIKGTIIEKINNKEAVTHYEVISRKEGYSVVEVKPETGRTNQIRIHFKSIGHPLLGERKYAFGKDFKVKFRRTALHARELSFTHPITGKKIYLKASIPDDMKKML